VNENYSDSTSKILMHLQKSFSQGFTQAPMRPNLPVASLVLLVRAPAESQLLMAGCSPKRPENDCIIMRSENSIALTRPRGRKFPEFELPFSAFNTSSRCKNNRPQTQPGFVASTP